MMVAVAIRRSSAAGQAAAVCCALLVVGPAAYAQDNAPLIRPPSADVKAPPAPGGSPVAGTLPDGDTAKRAETADVSMPTDADDSAASEMSDGERSPATAARIEPATAERSLPMEEVIVINESEWRLPDLGSSWREAEAAKPDNDRIQLSFLPLYDPEAANPIPDLYERNSALHRMQMIEVIRLRFGGRPQD